MKHNIVQCPVKSSFFGQWAGSQLLDFFSLVLSKKNTVNLAISGGSTPINVFKYWASSSFNQWNCINLYWVDERFVPLQDSENNARNAMEILSKLPLKNVFRMDTSLSSPQEVANSYERLLWDKLPRNNNGFPAFDVVMLGMGEDAHTGSLFPNSVVLHNTQSLVAPVYVEKLASHRITLTYTTILNADKRFVLFGGLPKWKIFNKSLETSSLFGDFPIKKIYEESISSDDYLCFI